MSGPPEAAGLVIAGIRLPRDYAALSECLKLRDERGVAGFAISGGDLELLPPFVASLREGAGRPILVFADCDPGPGLCVDGLPELPPPKAIAAAGDVAAAYLAGKIAALSARRIGADGILGPVLAAEGVRAFSDDPEIVARIGIAFFEGVQEEGVLAAAAGYRDPVSGRKSDPGPFRAAAKAGAGLFVAESAGGGPAGSPPRAEWGYGGLWAIDLAGLPAAAAGSAAEAALCAGYDLLLRPDAPGETLDAIEAAIANGRIAADAAALARGRVRLAAADLVSEAPPRRDLSAEYGFPIREMARRALTLGGDPDGLAAPGGIGGPETMAIVLDQDGRPGRARVFDPWRDRFPAGVVHVVPEGAGGAGGLAGALHDARAILLAIFADARRGVRPALSPELEGFARAVLAEHARKTLLVVFGEPAVGADLPARNVVFAYGAGDGMVEAAVEAILAGGELPGRLPVAAGETFPRGAGRGFVPEGR